MKMISLAFALVLGIALFSQLAEAAPIIQSTTNISSSASSFTIAKPSGVVEGDLLILAISADLSASEYLNYTVDSNFINLTNKTRSHASNAGTNLQTWYKIANSTEPSSYTIQTDHGNLVAASMIRIDGHNSTNPFNNYTVEGYDDGTEAKLPNITTTVNDTLILGIATWDASKSLVSIPSGWIEVFHTDVSGHDQHSSKKNQSTAGSIGIGQYDLSSASPHVAATISIQEPPAGGGGDATIPQLYWTLPANNTNYTNNSILITYNVSDNNTLANLSIYINGILNHTVIGLTNNISLNQSTNITLQNGQYNISINLTDTSNNINGTVFRIINVSVSTGGGGAGSGVAWDTAIIIIYTWSAFTLLVIAFKLDNENVLPLKLLMISVSFWIIIIGLNNVPLILEANSSSIGQSTVDTMSGLVHTAYRAVLFGVVIPSGVYMFLWMLWRTFNLFKPMLKPKSRFRRR